jgi:hypothetical protein
VFNGYAEDSTMEPHQPLTGLGFFEVKKSGLTFIFRVATACGEFVKAKLAPT